ncbi:hypothetical protein PR048_000572, partial [Dryococelus australis]
MKENRLEIYVNGIQNIFTLRFLDSSSLRVQGVKWHNFFKASSISINLLGFYVLIPIKTKVRNRTNPEPGLILSLTNSRLRIYLLVSKKQSQHIQPNGY